MYDDNSLKGSKNIINAIKTINYKRRFYKENPTFFDPCGLLVFTGTQGSGKTLSAVKYILNLMNKYPNCLLVTNVLLKSYPIDNKRVFYFNDAVDFEKYNNGIDGVIFFLDEIALYFNCLDKTVNPIVLNEMAQQRKQRKHIVSTSQLFGRLHKAVREQFDAVVRCKNYFDILQVNELSERDHMDLGAVGTELQAVIDHKYVFFHDPKLYSEYDTLAKVQKVQLKDALDLSIFDNL